MELRITRLNMYVFPIYIKAFEEYPGIHEIHIYSKWNYGYFGNSYDHYLEINGERFSRRRFDMWLYDHTPMNPFLERELAKFKEKNVQ